jgi:hypothetical protein
LKALSSEWLLWSRKEIAASRPEPHTICFIDMDERVVSTFEFATGKWTEFDPPRDRAEFEPIV